MSTYSPAARAALAFAVAGREAADFARGLVMHVATPHLPAERTREVRRLRVLSLQVLDRVVIFERLAGTSWADLAEALCLPEDEVIRRYEPTVRQWSLELPVGGLDATIYGDLTTGLRHDHDPEGTAAGLDAWIEQHAEVWDGARPEAPVTRALMGA